MSQPGWLVTVRKSPMPFVKIYGAKMFSSSLWSQPSDVRIVFLWFLGTADAAGMVPKHGMPAVARLANVSVEAATAAVALLEAPDPDSSTPDYEGRRLLRQPDGGWLVTNAVAYRDYRSERQVKEAQRKAAQRGKGKSRSKSRARRLIESFDEACGNLAPPHVYDQDEMEAV